MKEAPVPGWIPITSLEEVIVPAHGAVGYQIAEKIEVPAWQDPVDGEIYLTSEAEEKLAEVKARYMGPLSPEQFKELREYFGMSQKEISALLQIGARSWSRWECGKERPSRMTNLLLSALYEGELHIDFFKRKQEPKECRFAAMRDTPMAHQADAKQKTFAHFNAHFETCSFNDNEPEMEEFLMAGSL